MVIPDAAHPTWVDLISGKQNHDFGFLAARILMGRLAIQAQSASDEELLECARELHNLFVQNQRLPAAKKDLESIFGGKENR